MARPDAFEPHIGSSTSNTSEIQVSPLFESGYTPDTTRFAQPMRASENFAASDTSAELATELKNFHVIGGSAQPNFSPQQMKMHSDLFPEDERPRKTDKEVLDKLKEVKSFVYCTGGDNGICTPYKRN